MSELSSAAQAVITASNCAGSRIVQLHDEVCLRWAELKHPADVLNTIADELETQ
jgi:hypothetical protein